MKFTTSATSDSLLLQFDDVVSEEVLVNFESLNTSIHFFATPVDKLISYPIDFLTRSFFLPYSIKVYMSNSGRCALNNIEAFSAGLAQMPMTGLNGQVADIYL